MIGKSRKHLILASPILNAKLDPCRADAWIEMRVPSCLPRARAILLEAWPARTGHATRSMKTLHAA